MKKMLQAALLLALLGTLSFGVHAAEKSGSQEIDVNARYQTVSSAPASYSVDLLWSDMTFTYVREDTHIWNAADHSYKTRSRGGWDRTRASITVTNHSNVDVRVRITYTPQGDTGITGTLKNASGTLKAGAVGDYSGADSMTATLVISGKPTDAVTADGIKIGSLKVTIE